MNGGDPANANDWWPNSSITQRSQSQNPLQIPVHPPHNPLPPKAPSSAPHSDSHAAQLPANHRLPLTAQPPVDIGHHAALDNDLTVPVAQNSKYNPPMAPKANLAGPAATMHHGTPYSSAPGSASSAPNKFGSVSSVSTRESINSSISSTSTGSSDFSIPSISSPSPLIRDQNPLGPSHSGGTMPISIPHPTAINYSHPNSQHSASIRASLINSAAAQGTHQSPPQPHVEQTQTPQLMMQPQMQTVQQPPTPQQHLQQYQSLRNGSSISPGTSISGPSSVPSSGGLSQHSGATSAYGLQGYSTQQNTSTGTGKSPGYPSQYQTAAPMLPPLNALGATMLNRKESKLPPLPGMHDRLSEPEGRPGSAGSVSANPTTSSSPGGTVSPVGSNGVPVNGGTPYDRTPLPHPPHVAYMHMYLPSMYNDGRAMAPPLSNDQLHKSPGHMASSPRIPAIPSVTSDRPYRCPYKDCERSFARSSDQRRHIRSHEKPLLQCPYWELDPSCHRNGGAFNRLDVLKRHLKLVHFVQPNARESGWCKMCHKPFTSVKLFIEHTSSCSSELRVKLQSGAQASLAARRESEPVPAAADSGLGPFSDSNDRSATL